MVASFVVAGFAGDGHKVFSAGFLVVSRVVRSSRGVSHRLRI